MRVSIPGFASFDVDDTVPTPAIVVPHTPGHRPMDPEVLAQPEQVALVENTDAPPVIAEVPPEAAPPVA